MSNCFRSCLFVSASNKEYDVFLSFRGADVRKGIVSHLVRELSQKNISVFMDSDIERGKEISEALGDGIERSRISVVIFSANYASSEWCLNELVKILECREKLGQIVIPVFYNVNPSHVRNQEESFASSLLQLQLQLQRENKYDQGRMHLWRTALKYTANLTGFHSTNFQDDAALLDGIVNYILKKLNVQHPIYSEGLTGIRKPIVIWKMGGRGKVTTAELYYFVSVKEESRRHGIISLKGKVFSAL